MHGENTRADDLEQLLKDKVDNLRPKLLDLSRRNPLISTNLSPRSASVVRVVDELPDVLFSRLINDQSMRLVPLPPLDDDPRDEETADFQNALSEARVTDEVYTEEMSSIDPDDEEYLEKSKVAERSLKDRVRGSLGMEPHASTADITIIQHAKNNGISPSFDLPSPDEVHEDGRHVDDDIQTLLVPRDLERKLTSVSTKSRTFLQETGINVLRTAFGFLEWVEPNGDAKFFAPLVLLPIEIERVRTRGGSEFWIKEIGEDAEQNLVLTEKLKLEFGLILPSLEGRSIEDYLAKVSKISAPNLKLDVRRQVVLGVFPSARMAMYHDLNTSDSHLTESTVLSNMLVGGESSDGSVFADEYEIDQPEIEKKVPSLVLDADSSQFSALVDLADGKNLAIEGPPGTGKSQTIVNEVATALATGKKVLFVAEKMAALNVVKSRLEAVGLGEFVLPLQADRSTRERVVATIRDRVEMTVQPDKGDLDAELEAFRTYRSELNNYSQTLSSAFGSAGFNVHDILGKSIATQSFIEELPASVRNIEIGDIETRTKGNLLQIKAATERLMVVAAERKSDYWRGLKFKDLDKFSADEICSLAQECSDAFRDVAGKRRQLSEYSIGDGCGRKDFAIVAEQISEIQRSGRPIRHDLLRNIMDLSSFDSLNAFFDDIALLTKFRIKLTEQVGSPEYAGWDDRLDEIKNICESINVSTLDVDAAKRKLTDFESDLKERQTALRVLRPFVEAYPPCSGFGVNQLKKASQVVSGTPDEVLALRSKKRADVGVSKIIHNSRKTAEDLIAKREEIKSACDVNVSTNPSDLRKAAAIVQEAGFLRFLSSEYREAKDTYRNVSLRGKVDRAVAVKDLNALADWLEACGHFAETPRLTEVLGGYSRGIDSDFVSFERLMEYYSAVDDAFNATGEASLRDLLKTGDATTVKAIPDVRDVDFDGNCDALEEEIESAAADIRAFATGLSNLESLLSEVHRPERFSVQNISKLREYLRKFRHLSESIENNAKVRNLLGGEFKGKDTLKSEFEGELGVARVLISSGEASGDILLDLMLADCLGDCAAVLESAITGWDIAHSQLGKLAQLTGIPATNFTNGRSDGELASYLSEAANDRDGLYTQSRFASAYDSLGELGFRDFLREYQVHRLPYDNISGVVEGLVARSFAKAAFRQHRSSLARYQGEILDDRRLRLKEADERIIRLSRKALRHSIYSSAVPPPGNRVGKKSTWTELALIENEINKKKRFVSVRDLTARANKALLELKPCWMMSPLAVAQYLPKGITKFDLCIIDEASQMPPEDAIGALARCEQAMVVGDTNQLPPTSFFRRIIDDEEIDEDEAVLDESVLELANAAFRPNRRLRWHYRSRHSGLIKFSNRFVYDDDLIVFPSANEERRDMGVSLVNVQGTYKSGVNGAEATVMVDAIVAFMRENPNRSLGVVTLNQKQRDLLIEEVEFALSRDRVAADYVDDWKDRRSGLESFFIKNLENVQGDERDVIFIGTVYGPAMPGGACDAALWSDQRIGGEASPKCSFLASQGANHHVFLDDCSRCSSRSIRKSRGLHA